MTFRENFHDVMQKRRIAKRDGNDLSVPFLTTAARTYYWIIKGVPSSRWDEMTKELEK